MDKILHLFCVEKFTNDYVRFINENFTDNYHEFWIFGDRAVQYAQLNIFTYRNVKYARNIIDQLNNGKIYQFDKIIYHGVFDQNIIDFFVVNRRLLNKLYLYFWGGDKFYLKNKWDNAKKKFLIRNAHAIITILPEEQRFLLKYYRPKGKLFCAFYCLDGIRNYMQRRQIAGEEKDYIAVLLGNSATQTNHHIDMLHKLSKYKDEDIRIYAPLSYGDFNYAKTVVDEGRKIFGEKFIAIKEFMEQGEYFSFLDSMDIGIFDMNRQQALGNIMALLAFGKKIYFRNHSVLKHYFLVENHCDIWTTDEIGRMSFSDFISFSQDSVEKNEMAMKRIYMKEYRIEEWEKIFDAE